MLGVWLALAVGWSTPAGAQMPPGIGGSLAIPSANARYLMADVVSKRFPGEDLAGPTFKTGEQVDVIVEEGGSVRVRQGERYGWVPAAQLTATAPMPTLPAGGNPLLGGLQPLQPAAPASPVKPQ